MRRLNLLDLATIVAVLALGAAAVWVLFYGPTDPIPMHFNWRGEPDRWGDRTEAGLLIGFMAVTLAVVGGGCAIYARRSEDAARRRGLIAGQLVSLITVVGSTALIIGLTLGGDLPSPAAQMGGLSLLFLAIGAFLGRVGPNVAVGVRTPWSFKSKLAWERSNRLAGRLFFLLGLAGLIATPFAPQPIGTSVLIAGVIIAALWSVFESWRVWRADPDRQPF
ncbi:MAG: putative membrane protein [Brevundimonas sp.]|jgi:uncharacterized membrane protein|uniref:SdpI family protein n=1 Tax=Brevundimonas sp. TaxID=1871086 RepID=UPI0039E33E2C